jgi:Lar family restriction alleviation protein
MKTKLQPCPHCGEVNEHYFKVNKYPLNPWHIECLTCGALGLDAKSDEEAREKWNRMEQ